MRFTAVLLDARGVMPFGDTNFCFSNEDTPSHTVNRVIEDRQLRGFLNLGNPIYLVILSCHSVSQITGWCRSIILFVYLFFWIIFYTCSWSTQINDRHKTHGNSPTYIARPISQTHHYYGKILYLLLHGVIALKR